MPYNQMNYKSMAKKTVHKNDWKAVQGMTLLDFNNYIPPSPHAKTGRQLWMMNRSSISINYRVFSDQNSPNHAKI